MRSLPNILKYFMKPQAEDYHLPDTEQMADTLEEMIRLKESVPYEGETLPQSAGTDEPTQHGDMEPEDVQESVPQVRSLSFARAEADALLRDAHAQAEEIIAAAKQAAETEVAKIHQQAAEKGYSQGYADGAEKGRKETAAATEAAAQQSIQEMQCFLQQAAQLRDDSIDRLREELLQVAITVAEKVIHVSLQSSEEIIRRMMIAAIDKLKRREWVQIYVADCDVKGAVQADPALASALSGLSSHVKIVPMHDAEPGTCIVEMPDEIIDASASTQLDNIRAIVRENT